MGNASRARLPKHLRIGRSGRRAEKIRKLTFERYGDTCWRCGHPGASDSDHVVPLSHGGDPLSLDNRRPAHGKVPCYRCPRGPGGRPRRCNQERGNALPSARATMPKRSNKGMNTSEAW